MTIGSYALTPEETQALLALTREMISRTTALQDHLKDAARAASLDPDLVQDHLTGWLEVALDRAARLEYALAHPPKTRR